MTLTDLLHGQHKMIVWNYSSNPWYVGNTRWRFRMESLASGKKGDYAIPDFDSIEGFFERIPAKASSVLFVPVFEAPQYRGTNACQAYIVTNSEEGEGPVELNASIEGVCREFHNRVAHSNMNNGVHMAPLVVVVDVGYSLLEAFLQRYGRVRELRYKEDANHA